MTVAASVLAGACKDSTPPRVPTTMTLSVGAIALDAIEASQQITPTVLDQNRETIPNAHIVWTSTAPNVATVTTSGLVAAAGNGAAVIEAEAGAASATAAVQVTQVAVAPQKVSGDAQMAIAAAALPQPLKAKAVDRLGHAIPGQAVTFKVAQGGGSVSAPQVTAGPDGVVSTNWTLGPSVSASQAVTASIGDVGPATSFTATAVAGPPVGLGFGNGGQAILFQGGTAPSTAAVRDANGNPIGTVPLTYLSRDPSIATVNASGTITGVARGQAVIVASSGSPAFSDSLLAVVGAPGAPILITNLTGFSLRADTTRTVSILVNMGASATNVSSGLVTVTWDPAVLQYTGNAAGAAVSATVNGANAATGSVTFAFATAAGATGNIEVLKLTFHAATFPGATTALTLTSSEMTASDFSDLTPNMVRVVQRIVLR